MTKIERLKQGSLQVLITEKVISLEKLTEATPYFILNPFSFGE